MRNPSVAAEQHLRQLGIICFAIVVGVVIFGGVVWYLLGAGLFTPLEGLPSYLGTVFNLTALVILGKAHLLPRLSPPPSSPEAPEEAWLSWHKRNTIIGFALREGAAFLALVGVLLTGQQAAGFAVAGLAIVAMVFAWPRADQLEPS
jgi:hypothetical protein